MKKKITMLFLVAAAATTYAQDPGLGIGKGLPDASAILDVNASDKGVLIPRMELKKLDTFELAGKSGTESILIYNTVGGGDIPKGFYYWAGNASAGKWELITSESRLNTIIENLRKEIYEEIEKITKIPGDNATDLSYLVAFNPDEADPTKGKFSYLDPTTVDGTTTYTLKEITLEDIIKGTETETFIRPVKGTVATGETTTKEVTIGYYYFSETAIKKWKADRPDEKVEDIENSYGTHIDVAGIAGDTFIDNLIKNEEFINNTFINIKGNITLHKDPVKGYYFESIIDENTTETTYFNDMEVHTTIGTGIVSADGAAITYNVIDSVPTGVKKGEIYYQYTTEGENGTKLNYINLTADLITTITNNKEIKEEITNVVNNFLDNGTNVYYGKIDPVNDPTAKDILFSVDKDGNRHPIDISENIINEINTNTTVQNTIKKVTKIELAEGEIVSINTSLNGVEVFRLLKSVKVAAASAGVPYNMQLSDTVDLGTTATKVLSIQILNKAGSVVLNTARDISITGGKLSFTFGHGQTILPLSAGDYEIIVEFVATTP